MSDARSAMLAKIRKTLGERDLNPARIMAEAEAALGDRQAIQPKFDNEPALDRFIAKATSDKVTATVEHLPSLNELPRAVAAYLRENHLPPSLCIAPDGELGALAWDGIDLHHDIAPNEPVALGRALYGIAETGTLVFHSGPHSPVLHSFLPLHHLIAVRADAMLRTMEDYWDVVRDSGLAHPRNINLITGTSGTADIEAKNIRGAHGPRYMHIFIIG